MQSKQQEQDEQTSPTKEEAGPLRRWLNQVVDRNQEYFAELMAVALGKHENEKEESDPEQDKEEQRLLDAKLIMAYSGKSVTDKLEYGVKLAAMALGNYIEDTDKSATGIHLLNQEYQQLRQRQISGANSISEAPLMNSVIVARAAAYTYIHLLGLDPTRLQLFSINGECWFSYTSVTRYGISKRIQFCVEDILIEFFTTQDPVDHAEVVNKVLKHLPYRFMLSKDERQREFDALLKSEDPDHIYTSASTNDSDAVVNILDKALIMSEISSPNPSDDISDGSVGNLAKKMGDLDKDDIIGGEWIFQIESMVSDYVLPFVRQMERADKLMPGRFKAIKQRTIDLFREDKFLF